MEYFNEEYNIILPQKYFSNLKSYEYSKILKVNDEGCFDTIQKDYFKDFYGSLIDSSVEPRWGENLLDKLELFNSPYDYFILDLEDIASRIDSLIY